MVLATGPSLCAEDVDYCRGKARVIAVNDAYRLAPWADALYASDASWWHRHDGVPGFTGAKWSVDRNWHHLAARFPSVQRLRHAGTTGISTDPTSICTGQNSTYAAMNLAVLYGATRIVFLGLDMGHQKGQPAHFFGNHPGALNQPIPFPTYMARFESAGPHLKALGISVVNCSRVSRLACFPKANLAETLTAVAA